MISTFFFYSDTFLINMSTDWKVLAVLRSYTLFAFYFSILFRVGRFFFDSFYEFKQSKRCEEEIIEEEIKFFLFSLRWLILNYRLQNWNETLYKSFKKVARVSKVRYTRVSKVKVLLRIRNGRQVVSPRKRSVPIVAEQKRIWCERRRCRTKSRPSREMSNIDDV